MIAKYSKYYLSVINKIRAKEKIKNPPIERVKTKPYQINDVCNVFTEQQAEEQRNYLTPYQLYLIDTKSLERPYTGRLWGEVSAGFYHCAVCNSRLFSFDQKIFHSNQQTGHASFYDYVQRRVQVVDEKVNMDLVNIFSDPFLQKSIREHKRCQCKQCKTHLGAVFFDGPYPTFVRFSINSALLNFVELGEFQNPIIKKKQKLRQLEAQKMVYLK